VDRGFANASIPEVEEEEEEGDEQGPSLSELANQLFGDGADPVTMEQLFALDLETAALATADDGSTLTPSSPKASTTGGGAPSERSEPATEDGAEGGDMRDSPVAGAGIRLLQQRRRLRAGAVEEESDDLVERWMKQRW